MFKGSFVALVTPFRDGAVDEAKLTELVEWQISEGTDGLVPVGTTGESATLSHKEHARVIAVVAKATRGRVPVVAGAGSNSTAEAIALTREAQELGADAVLSVCPYYNRPTQEGLIAHFSAIADAVDMPIILYNIPSRTGVNLMPETVAALGSAKKNIVGVKEASANMDHASDIRHRLGARFCVLSGDDALTLPLMALGAQGVISVAANVVPKRVSELVSLLGAGQHADALERHVALFPLFKVLFVETSPAPIKAAMREAGLLDEDAPRLPLVPVGPKTREKICAVLETLGVFAPAGRV